PLLYNLFRPSVQPYFINWLKYEPVEVLSTFEVPILIVQGTTDIQVSAENAELLSNANSRAKLVIIDGMNHVLKQAEIDRTKNMSTYSNPNLPIVPELVEAISDFILTH
ncbi:MAG TPA: alpha/beta hydrolase, partial [Tenuifilaceae bacterium]|nr:alpha/beta hydrolase [Tenuifilaceae bacterium]